MSKVDSTMGKNFVTHIRNDRLISLVHIKASRIQEEKDQWKNV